jgi:hypothetical protein
MADPLETLDAVAPPEDPQYLPPPDLTGDNEGLPEDDSGPEDRKEPEPPVLDDIEFLESRSAPITRDFSDGKGHSISYVQDVLTFFGKLELYGILADVVMLLMEDDAIGINEILDMAAPKTMIDKLLSTMPGADTISQLEDEPDPEVDAAKMLSTFARVVSVAPEKMVHIYCVILNVPRRHRQWMVDWGLPRMDDEVGMDVLHVFIDQNWGVMEDFFARELPKLFKRAAKARGRHKSAGAQ